jgi:FkbM family methyltransferase
MNEEYLLSFQRSLGRSQQSRIRRIFSSPIGEIRSKTLHAVSCRLDRPIRVRAKTFWNEEMEVILPEVVSTALFRYRFFEEGLTRMLLQHVRPGMVFYDVGAHFGYFTLLASALVGSRGQVHAFEPTPRTYQMLQSNAKGHANIRVNNLAFFSREDVLTFNDFGPVLCAFNSLHGMRTDDEVDIRAGRSKSYGGAQTCTVRAESLDGYVARTGVVPDFVKIDAESSEYDILTGMEKTIETRRPMVTVEVGDMGVEGVRSSREMVQWMLERGYRALEFSADALREHQLKNSYSYCNLLFLPA